MCSCNWSQNWRYIDHLQNLGESLSNYQNYISFITNRWGLSAKIRHPVAKYCNHDDDIWLMDNVALRSACYFTKGGKEISRKTKSPCDFSTLKGPTSAFTLKKTLLWWIGILTSSLTAGLINKDTSRLGSNSAGETIMPAYANNNGVYMSVKLQ